MSQGMTRRAALGLAGAVVLAACDSEAGGPGNTGKLGFTNRLRIPPLLEGESDGGSGKRFRLTLQTGRAQLLPGKQTATLGINGDYLGPTLRARRGDRVAFDVHNNLQEVSTVHWHGMGLPAVMDGGPHHGIAPGATWSPQWTIDQPAATLWYHPHPHGKTASQVARGLAGLFIVDDPETDQAGLPHRYGIDDIPLIIQDKRFRADGSIEASGLGNDILVNGTHDPFIEADTGRVRLRLLNASTQRVFNLSFSDARSFHLIAADGGLLPQPIALQSIQLSPAERAEVVLQLDRAEQVILRSTPGKAEIEGGTFDILKITTPDRPLTAGPSLPQRLPGHPPPDASGATVTRTFQLHGTTINGRKLDMHRIDLQIPAGAREIWEIHSTGGTHSFHIHEMRFGVIDIDGQAPPPHLTGAKDTIFVPMRSKVRLAVQFGQHIDPVHPYMFHCHLLNHEDGGMMGQFVIVEP